jgi:hypothetical protein
MHDRVSSQEELEEAHAFVDKCYPWIVQGYIDAVEHYDDAYAVGEVFAQITKGVDNLDLEELEGQTVVIQYDIDRYLATVTVPEMELEEAY